MRKENEIFKGIITTVSTVADDAGTPVYTLYAKVLSQMDGAGIGSEFEVRQLSNIPTRPIGTRATAMPIQGQRVLLFRSNLDNVAQIVGYLEDTEVSIPLYERPIEPGEYKVITSGTRPTEFSIKPNEIKLDAGGYSNMTISQRTSSIDIQSKRYSRLFHGGYEENHWFEDTGLTPSASAWSKYKESNAASDKFNTETEELRTPGIGAISPYVDKVIERKGAILDYSSGGELLDHVYQLETRQDVGQTGTKNTFSVLKLGYQDKMAGDLPIRQGSIIDWSTKRVNSPTNVTTTVWRVGLAKNGEPGEMFRSQYADQVVVSPKTPVDLTVKDKGYELLDISIDNAASVQNFWQAESINTGDNDYFYRKGHGKTGFLHNYEESSKNSFIKRQSFRKDGTKNEFLEEMKQDSYNLSLETDNTTYYVKMAGNSIEIKMRASDSDDTTSVVTIDDSKAEVKFGKNSTITLTEGVCDIITDEKINLSTKDTTITSTNTLLIDTTGGTTTTKGNITFTDGIATMAGTPGTPSVTGAFCGLPTCLFTGAPHRSETSTQT